MINSRIWTVAMMLILAVVCSSSLAIVDMKISQVIIKNSQNKYMKDVLDVFSIKYDPLDQTNITNIYIKSIVEKETEGLKVFSDKKSGKIALFFIGTGYQGPISVIVALEKDTIVGFKVINQVETPGLGARITEDAFQKSFTGKKIRNGIRMVKTGHAGESEFDAITGATITSRSLEKILTNGFNKYFHTTAPVVTESETAPVIKENEQIAYMKGVLDVFSIKYDPANQNSVTSVYNESIVEKEIEGLKAFSDKKSGKTALFLIGTGYQGPISVIVALEKNIITGLKIVNQAETPGIGARITEDAFQKSFTGKKVKNGIRMVKTGKAGESEFNAITGATITSRSLEKILTNGFNKYFHTSAPVVTESETAPVIKENEQIKYMKDVLDVFGIKYEPSNQDSVTSVYNESVVEKEIDGLKEFSDKKSGKTALFLTGPGYLGPITVIVALENDSITNFKVVSQTETPGLGTKITEDAFQKSFIGKKVKNGIRMVKTGKAGESEFDAITGATITSKSLEKILTDGFNKYFHTTPQEVVESKPSPVIAENEKIKYMKDVLDIFVIKYDPLNQDSVTSVYNESVVEKEIDGLKEFSDKKSGKTALFLTGPGYLGPITVIVALENDSITNFKVVSQTETPGLGTKITEDAFQKSFIGKKVKNGITMVKTGKAGESEFDAITGATVTSKSLEKILNDNLSKYFETVKK